MLKGGGGIGGPQGKKINKRIIRKKPAPRPQPSRAPVTDAQSGGGYDLAPARRRIRRVDRDSDKRVKRATNVLRKKGIGGTPDQTVPFHRAQAHIDAALEQAINRLPTEEAREVTRLEARRGRETAAREGAATGTIRAWKDGYTHHRPPGVTARELALAIRQGFGNVANASGLLSQGAHLEIAPNGDIGLVGERRFLPDSRELVVPHEYDPARPETFNAVYDVFGRQNDYRGLKKAETFNSSVAGKALNETLRPAHGSLERRRELRTAKASREQHAASTRAQSRTETTASPRSSSRLAPPIGSPTAPDLSSMSEPTRPPT
jgi:hypothetical protein